MHVQPIVRPLAGIDARWIALGVFDNQVEPPAAVCATPLGDLVGRLLAAKVLPGALGELTPLFGIGGLAAEAVLVFGLGPREQFDAGAAFSAGVAAGKNLASKPKDSVAVLLPPSENPADTASALTEGLIVGTQGPGLRKTEPNRHPFGVLQVVISPEDAASQDTLGRAVARGQIVGEAVNLARELVNTPPSEKPPTRLAERMHAVAAAAGVEADVWDESRIREARFGGILGVASGSENPPAFLVLNCRRGESQPTLALVGKGVAFDSGGLSLKPSASMEDMKSDMAGAATVLATMQAVARLGLPVNLAGYLPLTENMPGGRAMKLGDVLTVRNGKTVEVLNTDAEGRLILADALSFAAEARPGRILDLATLTGSCIVALGTQVAGLFGTDESFCRDVLAACRRTGERAWRLPLDDDYKELLKSHVADLKNVGGKWAGAVTAAKFLEQFVGSMPWVHLDIAGPSWADTESAIRDPGATGCFVRTLVALIESATLPGGGSATSGVQ
jgi:leucyl aminopeptidase